MGQSMFLIFFLKVVAYSFGKEMLPRRLFEKICGFSIGQIGTFDFAE
jgi:hypothetical protein